MSQNKKCANLSEINNKFTEEMLTNILSKACNQKEVQLTDWNFNERSTKGDNYLSNVYKGKVNGIINDNPRQHVQVNIIVKSMPKNPGTRKTLRCAEFFRNEIAFYTEARLLHRYSSFSLFFLESIYTNTYIIYLKEFILSICVKKITNNKFFIHLFCRLLLNLKIS